MKREKIKRRTGLSFIPSGCTTLDLALGGGWAERRVSNVIGSQSTGKTLVAIEAATNFARIHPDGSIKFRETEFAFDEQYARSLGMPFERIELQQLATIEEMFDDVSEVIRSAPKPSFYIVDSLDALSDVKEQGRKFRDATYGTDKAAALSEFFRRRAGEMARADVTMLIVSQTRSNIGGRGRAWVRAGGKALDFYASQIAFLTQTSRVEREVKGLKRVTGITVRVKLEKNKVANPFREADFEITFGYGIDDNKAMIAFLDRAKVLDEKPAGLLKALRQPGSEALRARIREQVERHWHAIEKGFMPTMRKY